MRLVYPTSKDAKCVGFPDELRLVAGIRAKDGILVVAYEYPLTESTLFERHAAVLKANLRAELGEYASKELPELSQDVLEAFLSGQPQPVSGDKKAAGSWAKLESKHRSLAMGAEADALLLSISESLPFSRPGFLPKGEAIRTANVYYGERPGLGHVVRDVAYGAACSPANQPEAYGILADSLRFERAFASAHPIETPVLASGLAERIANHASVKSKPAIPEAAKVGGTSEPFSAQFLLAGQDGQLAVAHPTGAYEFDLPYAVVGNEADVAPIREFLAGQYSRDAGILETIPVAIAAISASFPNADRFCAATVKGDGIYLTDDLIGLINRPGQ